MDFERRASGILAPVSGPDSRYKYFADGQGAFVRAYDFEAEAAQRVAQAHSDYGFAEGLRADMATAEVVLAQQAADNTWANVATEQDLLLPQGIVLIPANSYWYPGKAVRVTAMGTIVTGAAPGNLTLAVRYGASSTTGVILATTGAIAMTASIATVFIWYLDVLIICRTIGQAGSVFALGNAAGLTSVTPPVQAHMGSAGPSAPVTAAIDTTVSTNALRITGLQSAAVAATQIILKNAVIESMN